MSRNKYPEETVNLILDVSQKLFLEKGYEHTTIQDIINNLGGLTKGAIYHHFKSKEDILKAVSNRLFSDNSLSKKWLAVKNNKQLNGSEKLKMIVVEAINDPQEQQFRSMGVDLRNSPQMLGDMLVRSVSNAAPGIVQPMIQEGIADGSITAENPKELAELMVLIANIWLNPLVFMSNGDELRHKLDLFNSLIKPCGIDIEDIYPAFEKMNDSVKK